MRTDVSARGAVLGPMREVVAGSMEYLTEPDLRAMAVYLKVLSQARDRAAAGDRGLDAGALHARARTGFLRCGLGRRLRQMRTPVNLVHVVLGGASRHSVGRD